MEWHVATERDLMGALAAAMYGHDPDAARNLIQYFHERFQDGGPYNNRVLIQFLTHAFGKIITEGWSADHAFGLKLKRGCYERENTLERDVIAAAYMLLLIRKKRNWLDAKGMVANFLFEDGKGEKAVEAAYAKYRESLSFLSDEQLIGMLPEGTPII